MGSRMRKKKNLLPRMERCAALMISSPAENKGRWREALGLPPDAPLHLELGCGKGGFANGMAAENPDTFFLALERVNEALLTGLESAFDAGRENLRFLSFDAAHLEEIFDPGELDRIYINFCDPWPPNNRAKRRLTHRNFLWVYKKLLRPGGEVFFKTDNQTLFDFSLGEFAECGFSLSGVTRDLHSESIPNVRTEYEEKFAAMGMPIYRLEARLPL